MLLLVDQPTQHGKTTHTRYINLDTVSTLGPADGDVATKGYATVLFTANGYAMYSKLSPEDIIQKANLKVIQ